MRQDPGAAYDAGSVAAFQAIEESRRAMSELGGEKPADLLKEQNALTKAAVDVLKSIDSKAGAGAVLSVVESLF